MDLPKWRETCDPFQFPFHNFELLEVLGYPPARNDVFHVRGLYRGKPCCAYLKAARPADSAIAYEARMLQEIPGLPLPVLLDEGREPVAFSLLSEMPGQRLSVLVGENKDLASLDYLEAYGKMLAQIHLLSVDAPPAHRRKFFFRPPEELLEKVKLPFLSPFFDRAPAPSAPVFCHGDFHYGNVLWQEKAISGILDWELCGYGDRNFDLAWALFLRPGQKFLKTEEEQRQFLKGYASLAPFDEQAVRYYMAQCYVYFLAIGQQEEGYSAFIRSWLENNCK